MFYAYGLSFDRAATISHAVSLSTASAEIPAFGTRKNGLSLPLSLVSAQIICGQSTDEFTNEFTNEFGGGIANYPLLSVGKPFVVHAAQTTFLVEPPTRFHVNPKAVNAASSQLPHFSMKHITNVVLSVLFGEKASAQFPRPRFVVVATRNSIFSGIIRLTSKLLPVSGSQQSVSFGSGRSLNLPVTAQEALQTLFKVVDLLNAVSSQRSQLIVRTSGKLILVASSEVANSFKAFGKAGATISAQVARIIRALPARINVASTEAPRLAFGGAIFVRVLAVFSASVVRLQHGQATLLGMSGRNSASMQRGAGKPITVSDGQAAISIKSAGIYHGANEGQTWLLRRQQGLVRGVSSSSVKALVTAGAHLGGALSAISSQIIAAFTQRAISRPMSLPATLSSTMALSSIRRLLRSLNVGSPQSNQIARGISKTIGMASGAAQAFAKAPRQFLAAASSGVPAPLIEAALHLFAGSVQSPEAIGNQSSRSLLRGTTSPETAGLTPHHGVFLAAVQGNLAKAAHGLAKLIVLASIQVVSVPRAIAKTVSGLVWTQAVSAIKGPNKAFSIASAETTSSIRRRGASIFTFSATVVSTPRRLISRLISAFTPQATGGGRGDTKALHATSPNSALALRPRGLMAGTIQGQKAIIVTYYHFFVATWAYQQTSLLPPAGGVAEPPSFGPIDPADQTIFAFDWASRAYPNDPITSAAVISVPPGLPILPGSVFVSGTLIEVTVPPFTTLTVPRVFSLRCTATFASGRVSSFSIPVPVRTL